jgi:hypothetical protein
LRQGVVARQSRCSAARSRATKSMWSPATKASRRRSKKGRKGRRRRLKGSRRRGTQGEAAHSRDAAAWWRGGHPQARERSAGND